MKSAVSVSDLRFGYGAGNDVLSVSSLSLEVGERAFLYGPSGSGKSTLLGLIGGVLVPSAGTVSVLDIDLAAAKSSERDRFRADHIGFVFQQFNLVPYLSVDENVCLPCRYSKRRQVRATESDGSPMQAAARLLHSLGINAELRSRKSTELSVGQQQRVAVARALIGRPELIIADEPTSALDSLRRGNFIDLLLAECDKSGSTIVFVSHDPALASHFNRSIDLEELNEVKSEAYA